jgi:hypothetical protein
MKVTRDVILDLLPLYFAGQVSADTKALVDDFLRTDPGFARMSERFDALLKERGDMPSPPETAERRALERTRTLLSHRNQTIGIAVGYSLAPFLFWFRNGHVEFVLWQRPVIAMTFGLVGLASWIAVFVVTWRARADSPIHKIPRS